MLLTMKTLTHAARCLAYNAAATLDMSTLSPRQDARDAALKRISLLTPLAKAWCSETASEVASLGVQIHGGAGYVDDSEISQIYRDARIGAIFEGTNYIQAQDLLLRKIVADRGDAFDGLVDEMRGSAQGIAGDTALDPLRTGLIDGCERIRDCAQHLINAASTQREMLGSIALPFLQWLGVLAGAWQWARSAEAAGSHIQDAQLARALRDSAAFYAAHILPRATTYEAIVREGHAAIAAARIEDI
jgi:hypothetical protein